MINTQTNKSTSSKCYEETESRGKKQEVLEWKQVSESFPGKVPLSRDPNKVRGHVIEKSRGRSRRN